MAPKIVSIRSPLHASATCNGSLSVSTEIVLPIREALTPSSCSVQVLKIEAYVCSLMSTVFSTIDGSGNMKTKNPIAGPAQRSIDFPPTSKQTPSKAPMKLMRSKLL
jgi:hypothetical protein